ncbi:hypothetical protein OKW21_003863 [Catalinimonas alkaloidigena]|nr:hypothetical protein [Catalinimonas alkaloidigena]
MYSAIARKAGQNERIYVKEGEFILVKAMKAKILF